jgi:hypothetical protein
VTQIKLPRRDAYALNGYGARVDGPAPNDPKKTMLVTLPPGWTADVRKPCGLPRIVHDQHGRTRMRIDWTHRSTGDKAIVTLLSPDSHAREVAEGNACLVIDSWAKPDSMIGVAAERVETFYSLIERVDLDIARWKEEQPSHTERLRADREKYERKLAAWTALFERLSQVILAGWTVRQSTAAPDHHRGGTGTRG